MVFNDVCRRKASKIRLWAHGWGVNTESVAKEAKFMRKPVKSHDSILLHQTRTLLILFFLPSYRFSRFKLLFLKLISLSASMLSFIIHGIGEVIWCLEFLVFQCLTLNFPILNSEYSFGLFGICKL